MAPISKHLLSQLYTQRHFSITEVSTALNCSPRKVHYWLKKYNIQRRSHSESNYYKYNPDGDPFKIKNNLTLQDIQLKLLCIGLYWGEGGKSTRHATRIGNSDPNMIKVFYTFLQTVCNVKEQKIRFHLQVFKDQSVKSATVFWAKQLNISQKRITNAIPMPPLGKGSYKKTSKYGVLTIAVYNIKLKKWIVDELSKIGYNPDIKDQLLGW